VSTQPNAPETLVRASESMFPFDCAFITSHSTSALHSISSKPTGNPSLFLLGHVGPSFHHKATVPRFVLTTVTGTLPHAVCLPPPPFRSVRYRHLLATLYSPAHPPVHIDTRYCPSHYHFPHTLHLGRPRYHSFLGFSLIGCLPIPPTFHLRALVVSQIEYRTRRRRYQGHVPI